MRVKETVKKVTSGFRSRMASKKVRRVIYVGAF